MAGANDVSRNERKVASSTLKKTLEVLTHTNVIVVNVPHRHDLPQWSCVNKEVEQTNKEYKAICMWETSHQKIRITKAKKVLSTARKQVAAQKRRIDILRIQNTRSKKKVTSLSSLLDELKAKTSISDEVCQVLEASLQ
ncbi:uncharacterized protein LOC126354070 [Schistocerca gregaria]|uniref:uncharacterized protein LOC126354070 n=1 Tax=Schistocerca gregaria TaxID=7010 RepID=UPI00211E8FC7|nr:uncharacterized protein LOC126354070 [Schistocerca gregaria]